MNLGRVLPARDEMLIIAKKQQTHEWTTRRKTMNDDGCKMEVGVGVLLR